MVKLNQELINIVGKNIRELREERFMSRKDLADALGLTVQAISQYENCKRLPSDEILNKMQDVFSINTSERLYRNHVELNHVDEFEAFLKFLGYDVSELHTPIQYQAIYDEECSQDRLVVNGCELYNDDIEDLCSKLKEEIDYYLKLRTRR